VPPPPGAPPNERLRFSLAGVQAKFAVTIDDAGRFLPPLGGAPTTHVVKVERSLGRERGIVANEFACLDLCRRLGLATVEARRQDIAGTPCLVVTRFDRRRDAGGSISRLHQEDAAQVLGIDRSLKYERDAAAAGLDGGFTALFGGFAEACGPALDARDALFRATFANWLVGNSDAHLKNFALLQAPASPPIPGLPVAPVRRLAPFYDIVCIAAWPDFSHDLAMRLGAGPGWDSVGRAHWEALGGLAFGRRSRTAIRRAIERLHDLAVAALPSLDAIVAEGLATRPACKPVRDVIGSRLRHLNASMGWDIPAETDAPITRGGGWALS